jgi:AcrR family transcriptional regulator
VPQSRTSILRTVEDLLRSRRIDELTVAEIVEAAGVSRATFYVHFESKFSVVVALVGDVVDEVVEIWRQWFEGDETTTEEALRRYLAETHRRWGDHPALLSATVEGWHTDPEIHALWGKMLTGFAESVAARIERDRRAAGRPPGDDVDALALATALTWLNERCLYLAASSPESVLSQDEDRLIAVLAAIWARTLRVEPQTP